MTEVALGTQGHLALVVFLGIGDGSWILGLLGKIGMFNILHAELLALLDDLKLLWDGGYSSLMCYTDSLHVMSLALAPVNSCHQSAIVHNTKDLLSKH